MIPGMPASPLLSYNLMYFYTRLLMYTKSQQITNKRELHQPIAQLPRLPNTQLWSIYAQFDDTTQSQPHHSHSHPIGTEPPTSLLSYHFSAPPWPFSQFLALLALLASNEQIFQPNFLSQYSTVSFKIHTQIHLITSHISILFCLIECLYIHQSLNNCPFCPEIHS